MKSLRASYLVVSGVGAADIALVKEYFPYLAFHREDYFRNILVFSKKEAHVADASLVREFPLINSDLELYVNTHKALGFQNDSISFGLKAGDDEFPFGMSLPLQKGRFRLGEYVLAEISYTATARAAIENERLCMAVSEQGKDAVFFNNANYKDYYDSSRTVQTTYLEYFVGVDNSLWERENMPLNAFVWKAKESAYTIRKASLKQYSYNPTKWTLWD